MPSRGLHLGLWIAQALLALTFVGTGLWKLLTPIPELAAKIPWAAEVSPTFLYTVAAFNLLGGVGVILPSLTRVAPRVTVLAAIGCAALQGCAVVFHFQRGEAANTPFNFFLIGLALFVAYGRWKPAPIAPR
jgi:hypothetical protein